MEEQESRTPHILIFPFPSQGHINSMLNLAELFALHHFHVTFLNTQHNQDLMSKHVDIHVRFDRLPEFRFRSIPDGLPPDHPRAVGALFDLNKSLQPRVETFLRDMVNSSGGWETGPPVTCIIADGILPFTIDIAEELGVPIMMFRTSSPCTFWAYFCVPKLIEAGELPLKEGADMDRVLNCIPGMEGLLRFRDLPSFFRTSDLNSPGLQYFLNATLQAKRAYGQIFNTYEDLDASTLSQIRAHFPNVYAIGPLHSHVRSSSNSDSSRQPSTTSLWKEDRSCIEWLDKHSKKSVIYISFGSLTVITRDQYLEFMYGLVNSRRLFLWVLRPDMVAGKKTDIPDELLEGTKERGLLVDWAPQFEVLAHPSVAGFLTHNGWNSTIESVAAGVPMICWPFFGDQQINSRFVSHVWKVGLDMKDCCSRVVVEKLVGELMVGKREELEGAAGKMAELARRSVSEGGSSYYNFERLMGDIRSLSLRSSTRNQEKSDIK